MSVRFRQIFSARIIIYNRHSALPDIHALTLRYCMPSGVMHTVYVHIRQLPVLYLCSYYLYVTNGVMDGDDQK